MNQKNGVLLTLSLLALAFIANACDTTAVAGDGTLGQLCDYAVCTDDTQCFSGECSIRTYLGSEGVCVSTQQDQPEYPPVSAKVGSIDLGLLIGLIAAGVIIFVLCIIFCFCRGVIACVIDCICCCCPRRKAHPYH